MSPPAAPRVLFCRASPIAPEPRIEKEARALLKAGYSISILGWDRTASLPVNEEIEGCKVYRIPIRAEFATGMMNLLKLARWQAALFTWLNRHRAAYDIIHACDFDTVLPALWAQKYWGKKVVYDIFDFYADHIRNTPDWIKGLIRKVDLKIIGQVDLLIICGEGNIEQIRGSLPKRMVIITNSPEDEGAPTTNGRPASHRGFHLTYVGQLQLERGLFEALEVLQRHPDWHLDLAGFGGDEERILAAAKKLPNVTWHGRISYLRAIQLSRSADVLFALHDPANKNHRFSSPHKVFEAFMLGKPIIVAKGTNMERLITAACCGLVVPYGDVAALDAALVTLASDPGLCVALGSRARRAYETQFAWNIMEQRLLTSYQELQSS